MNEPLVDVTGARREREGGAFSSNSSWLGCHGRPGGCLRTVLGRGRLVPAGRARVNVQGPPATVESVQDVAAIEIGTPLVRVDAPGAAADRHPARGGGGGRDPQLAQRNHDRREEREPRLAVPNGSRFNLVDATGVSFAEVPSVPKGVTLADVPASDLALLQAVAKVADLLERCGRRPGC